MEKIKKEGKRGKKRRQKRDKRETKREIKSEIGWKKRENIEKKGKKVEKS